MEKKSVVILALALAAIVFAFGPTLAVAQETDAQADADAVETAEAGEVPVTVAGMTVWIDQETGKLRQPTAKEAAALAKAMRRMFGDSPEAKSFTQVERADGSVMVDLGLSQLDYSVATIGADGRVAYDCVDTAHEAGAHVHNQVQTPEEK